MLLFSLRVSYGGVFLHDIKERQLVDSVEWESTKLKRGELFQVFFLRVLSQLLVRCNCSVEKMLIPGNRNIYFKRILTRGLLTLH